MASRINLTNVMVSEPEEAMIRSLAAEWDGLTDDEVNVIVEERFGGVPRRADIIYSWALAIIRGKSR